MTTPRIPHNLSIALNVISHGAIFVGAIVLYLGGKIDSTAFAAIMAAGGALWSGVAGVLISTRQTQPSTAPGGSDPAPGATAAPSSHSVTPQG